MISPKQAFQQSAYFKDFSNAIESESVQSALRMALLHYQQSMPEASDPEMSHAQRQRIIGATQFVSLLSRFCDSEKTISPQYTGNLNHKA